MLGVCGYVSPTACVGLMTSGLGLANTLAGNQGQGPSAKRDTIDLPRFSYGSNLTSDSMIDMMNHALDLAQNPPQQTLGGDVTIQQACSNNNANIFTGGHWWEFKNDKGIKLQCKNGCGYHDGWDSLSMESLINGLVSQLMLSGNPVAQFTLYNNNGRVFSRCKLVFETEPTDSCPELITGEGCQY